MLVAARLASASALSSSPHVLAVREETDTGPVVEATAHGGAIEVIARYPQACAGEQHVIGTEPAAPGGVVGQRAGRGGQALHARRRDSPGALSVAVVRVFRPSLVAAEVRGTRVGGGGIERVTAGVVDPEMADGGLGGWEGGRRIAQPGPRGRPGWRAVRLVASRGDVDGRVVRGPGGGLQVERLVVVAFPVELGRRPGRDGGRGTAQVEHEDLLPGLAAHRK